LFIMNRESESERFYKVFFFKYCLPSLPSGFAAGRDVRHPCCLRLRAPPRKLGINADDAICEIVHFRCIVEQRASANIGLPGRVRVLAKAARGLVDSDEKNIIADDE
jgi:hypothetical protein